MRQHWCWILAAGIAAHGCASDHVVQTPSRMIVLTREGPWAPSPHEVLRPARVPDGTRLTSDPGLLEPVLRVSSRLIAAARQSPYGARARSLCWIVAVYDDAARPRAFVGSDGNITVYTAALRFLESEAGLAALLAHELVHALAAETSPPADCVTGGSQEPPPFTYQEELHADEVGLALMADAGYDPRELLRLWERIKVNDTADDEVLQHFIYDRRMERIAQRLPEALLRYERTNRAPHKALPAVK